MNRLLLIVAVAAVVLVTFIQGEPATGEPCEADLGLDLGAGCGTPGGSGGDGGTGGGTDDGGGSVEPARYYWQHVTPADVGDPTSLLCQLSVDEVGVEYWEELIDRTTGEALITRVRCIPLDAGAPEPEPTPDPPSPAEIWDAVPVPDPSVSVNPAGAGVTGLETWLWLDGTTNLDVGPLTLDGWSVRATATVERIVWEMGDGHSASSTKRGSEASPAATHTYERKSGAAPYTLTVTTRWHGTATINGFGTTLTQDLGTVTTSGSRPYDVDEVRSILIE